MTALRIAWDANTAGGRRRRRHYDRLKDHKAACELRRDAERRLLKHRGRMFEAVA